MKQSKDDIKMSRVKTLMMQRDSEKHNSKLRQQKQQKMKVVLMKELESNLSKLNDVEDLDFKDCDSTKKISLIHDELLDELQKINRQAVQYQLKQVEKLCKLAIGRRILNIELKKKKEQQKKKKQNKQKIELYFRNNKISKYDYTQLMRAKLNESTIIAPANKNGKGIDQHMKLYQNAELYMYNPQLKFDYKSAFEECNYWKVLKEINHIFFKNYTGKDKETSSIEFMYKIVWVPIILFMSLSLFLPFFQFQHGEYVITSLLGLILLFLTYISFKLFCDDPNNNNQMEQTIEDVKQYLQVINSENQKNGKNIEWFCQKEFMYIEIIFSNGLPQQKSSTSSSIPLQ